MDNKTNNNKAKGIISRKQDMSNATRRTPDGIQILNPKTGKVILESKNRMICFYSFD